MLEFEGKVAFVTGGASGIGFALARALGRAKMRVMLADIDVDGLNSAVAEFEREGIDARCVECDVTDRASVQRAATETLAAFHKVHVVCSNAGVVAGGPMELISPGDWDWVIGTSAMGFVHVIQAFLPHLKSQREGGHIVATSAMGGMVCTAGNGPHHASKFALVALAETLAEELKGTSIGVSVLCTAFVRTRNADSARNRPQRFGSRTVTAPAAAAQLAALIRSGEEPDEVAEKVLRAIRENELYIFTSSDYRSVSEARFQRILNAFPSS
jgi:NAD(P)-dependent dehydrogenase (short-subunit alcohol dehydrogenase family)